MTTSRSTRWELAALIAAGAGKLGLLVGPACTDDGGSDDGNWSPDARCVSLCDATTCPDPAVRQTCLDTCAIGLHATSVTCSACMLDNVCASGCMLSYSSAGCATECADTPAVEPGSDDPRCSPLCTDDNECTTTDQVGTCLASCDASVDDTSGPCASCLLDNVCATGCNFRLTDVSACNTLCN